MGDKKDDDEIVNSDDVCVNSDDDNVNSDDVCGDKRKTYSALVLAFSLPTSSYATIAVREILHISTGKAAMKKMNDYVKDDDAKDTTENVGDDGECGSRS